MALIGNDTTIVIPCYNQNQYLIECLNCISALTQIPKEIIIVDDGSKEHVNIIVDFWKENIDKEKLLNITIVKQENRGLSAARNTGIKEAKTSWVMTLDADDLITYSYFDLADSLLEKNKSINAISSHVKYFGAANGYWKSEIPILDKIKYKNSVPSCAIFKKELWETIGGFKSNMTYGYEDWEFWINCCKIKAIWSIIEEYAFIYRIKPNSMVKNAKQYDAYLRAMIVINNQELYTENELFISKKIIELYECTTEKELNKINNELLTLESSFLLQKYKNFYNIISNRVCCKLD